MPPQRSELVKVLDTLLADALRDAGGIVQVDRQSLDKVLAERVAGASGLARIAPDEVAAPLRGFWTAGVLIATQCNVKNQAILIEAVSTQTGQVVASLYAKTPISSAETVAKAIGPKLPALVRQITRGVARLRDKPLVEVSGRLAGEMTRLAWMVDDLAEAAGTKISLADNAVWLVPRQPIATKEERLLRVMGLADARRGDPAAGLSPVPRIRFVFELTDSAKTGVAFEKTPIQLKLSFQREGTASSETQLDGQIDQWSACRDRAVAWFLEQLAQLRGKPLANPKDDTATARQLAAEELAMIASWVDLGAREQEHLDLALRRSMARHALRAAHLDPTSEQAAYLAAISVEALYPPEGKDKKQLSLTAIDRGIAECQRYLDRFGRRNEKHYADIVECTGDLGLRGQWKLAAGPGRPEDYLRPPDVRRYPYVRLYVRLWAQQGYEENLEGHERLSNSFCVFSFNLISSLVPCMPNETLDEEYNYWRTFYSTKVAKILQANNFNDFHNTRPAPWDLVEAAFQARKKNPKAVRDAFQRLAAEFPRNQALLWGGDHGEPHWVPLLLRAAGDPEWDQWQPGFTAPVTLSVGLDEMTAFLAQMTESTHSSWDLSRVERLPAVPIVVPEAVKASGRRKGCTRGDVESLFLAGKDLWMITPTSAVGNTRQWNHLFVAPMKPAVDGKITLEPVEIAWPRGDEKKERPLNTPVFETGYVTDNGGKTTVWMVTQSNGLVRFDKTGDRWKGRWYTESDGFPSNLIQYLSSCRSGAKRVLVLVSLSGKPRPGVGPDDKSDRAYLWTLDPETDEVKIVLNDRERKTSLFGAPAVVTPEGKTFLVERLGRGEYDLDVAQIRSLTLSGIWGDKHDVVRDEKGAFHLLRLWWDAGPEGDFNRFDELSLETFKPLPFCPGRSAGRYSVFPFPECKFAFGGIYWRQGEAVAIGGRWPGVFGEFVQGRGQYLWIGFSNMDGHSGTSRFLVAYRPAATADKDWAEKDQWVGPFAMPDSGTITRMAPYGDKGLLLTTRKQMYLVDCSQVIEQAVRQGWVCSTAQWRTQYDQRLASVGWKDALPVLLQAKKWDQATQLLDAEQKRLDTGSGSKTGRMHVNLWRAHLLARKGDLADAAVAYDQAAEQAAASRNRPAEVFARMNQLFVLFHGSRYREMLDLCEKVNRRFPQTKPESSSGGLAWYLNEAKKKLAALPAGKAEQ